MGSSETCRARVAREVETPGYKAVGEGVLASEQHSSNCGIVSIPSAMWSRVPPGCQLVGCQRWYPLAGARLVPPGVIWLKCQPVIVEPPDV